MSKNEWIAVLAVFILGFVAYSNVIFFPFVHDDIVFIQNNPNIADLTDWRSVFLRPSSVEGSIIVPYWRPLLEIIYRFEYFFWGFNPAGYHVFNIFVHIVNACLIFFIFNRLVALKTLVLGLSLLFLLHPTQSQAVACVSGISNLAFTLFSLACFLCLLKNRLGISLLMYFLALLAKEQALVMLPLLGFYLWQQRRKDAWPAVGLFALISALYLGLRCVILGQAGADISAGSYEFFLRIKAIPDMLLTYLRLLVWPSDLHYYRSADILKSSGLAAAVLLLLVVGIGNAIRRIKEPKLKFLAIFGIAWFFIGLLPTLNIFPLVIEYSKVSVAEHFLYFPMIGFFLFLCVSLENYGKIFSQPQKSFAVVVVAMCFLLLTIRQNTFWRSEIALFERTLKYENLARVELLLGRAYYFNKQYEKAEEHYTKALTLMEDYALKSRTTPAENIYKGFIKGIHFDLAHVFEETALPEKAIDHYTQAIAIDPNDAALYNNLAIVYLKLGKKQEAKELLEKAVSINPDFSAARQNLNYLLQQR